MGKRMDPVSGPHMGNGVWERVSTAVVVEIAGGSPEAEPNCYSQE